MAAYDFTSHRLFVEGDLAAGAAMALDAAQANYLRNVLRLPAGAGLLVFNGREGEWRARLVAAGRKQVALSIEDQVRPQPQPADLWLLFAPLKHARLDYLVQKAVEMGVGRIAPVLTRRTQVTRLNGERMRANAIEAAEQCGIIAIPELAEPQPLAGLVAAWPVDRVLIFCDEDAPTGDGRAVLEAAAGRPLALLIGPEGGFDPGERDTLLGLSSVVRISLGPRILRADTAAVAALALVQATIGDWKR